MGVLILGILMQQRRPLAWWGNLMPLVIASVLIAFGFLHPADAMGFLILAVAWTAAVFALGRALWRAGLALDAAGETLALDTGSS